MFHTRADTAAPYMEVIVYPPRRTAKSLRNELTINDVRRKRYNRMDKCAQLLNMYLIDVVKNLIEMHIVVECSMGNVSQSNQRSY
jgi:hypothetical protein